MSSDIYPDSISFHSTSIGAVSWVWNFGDSSSSSDENPMHNYSVPGRYYVCLMISDSTGCSATFCDSIWVSNCSTDFGFLTGQQTSSVKFFDMPYTYLPTHYYWDFGDSTNSNLRLPIHTYNAPGDYQVCLFIHDSAIGCFYGKCKPVIVPPAQNIKMSVCDGNWTNGNTWNMGTVPVETDSVLIYNNVLLDTDVTIINPGFIYIEEHSSLCGHHTLTSNILTYGVLNVNWMTICNSDTNVPFSSYSDYIPINCLQGCQVGCEGGVGGWFTQYFPTSNPFSCNTPVSCMSFVGESEFSNKPRVFPNPFSNELNFELFYNQSITIVLYDFVGHRVLQEALLKSSAISTAQLANGIYFYELRNGREVFKTGKLVKQ